MRLRKLGDFEGLGSMKKGSHHKKESLDKLSKSRSGKPSWNKGKSWSVETKLKMSLARMGVKPWNTGLKLNMENYLDYGMSKKNHTLNSKNKIGIGHAGKKLSREHIKKVLRRRDRSSLEIKMENIILKNNLPYRFVGNGDFFIGRKCPDFVNTNGNKIAIEVYARRHKELFRGGLNNWKNERTKIFESFGWKLLYFDETQVKEEIVLKTLEGGFY